jgi:hypothetical protein
MKKVSKKGLIGMALVVVAVILVGSATALLADKETSATMVEDDVASLQKLLDENSNKISAEQSVRGDFTLPGGCYFAYLMSQDSASANKEEFGFYYPCENESLENGCCALYRIFYGSQGPGNWTIFNTTDENLSTSDDFGVWYNVPPCHQDWHRAIGGLYHSEQSCGICDKFEHFELSKMKLPKGTMIGRCPVSMAYIVNPENWCGGGGHCHQIVPIAQRAVKPNAKENKQNN